MLISFEKYSEGSIQSEGEINNVCLMLNTIPEIIFNELIPPTSILSDFCFCTTATMLYNDPKL